MKYVSLHHHSTFSYRDGFGMPAAHAERAADLGMSALALTEHGNVSSHVKHEIAANKVGIKGIYGCELYTAAERTRSKWHLTVLAETQLGYQNLNRLVSRSWAEGFYQWPTVNGPMLAEHADGLIVLSGCADSLLSCLLLGGKSNGAKRETASQWDIDRAEETVRKFAELFGDAYYLECQQFPDLQRTRTLNPIFAELSRRTGVPLVATSDVHYPFPEDNEMQKILHAAGRGTGSVEAQEATWEYDIRLTFPLSDAEIRKRLRNTGLSWRDADAAIANSAEIAERCNVVLPKNERVRFPVEPQYESKIEMVWEWLRDGWMYRWEENGSLRNRSDEYHKRLAYEMDLIVSKDYVDYFLMLSYLVRWAKDRGIAVGPARGSAAASLACYLLRITEVDPMQFPTMLFERFIDATREDLPDVDLDFADDRRAEVWREAQRIFGADHVGSLGNFVRYRGKNSIKDVARVYRIPKFAAEQVNALIIERSGGDSRIDSTLADTIEMFPAAQAIIAEHPNLMYATRLEGNMSTFSVHAAGIIISNTPITDTCAVYERERADGSKTSVIAYDKKDAAYLGMLKADFLGLSNMGMINIALSLIGMELADLYRVPLDDPKTMQGFQDNDVVGIFQFEGRATRLVCREVKPDNFMELADINALSRPGPLFSGTKTRYVNVKHGTAEVERLHPLVDRVTMETKGQIVYQEQVLSIIREIGGFPVTKVADIRKIISQKLGEASFNQMLDAFIEGAARLHNISEELARKIWAFLVTSATYSFNVAHSVSYSILSFWNMWLKQHHPLEFYAASLRKVDRGKWKEKGPRLLRDAQSHGITILPPDPEISGMTWDTVRATNALRAGFEQVPGIAAKTAEKMLHWRETFAPNAPVSWQDYTAVHGIGAKTMERIAEFAADEDPFGLDLVGKVLREFRAQLRNQVGFWRGFPRPTHTSDEMVELNDNTRVVWIGIGKLVEYKDLIEDQRARFGTTEAEIIKGMKDPQKRKWATIHGYDDGTEDVYLRFNRFDFPRFATGLEQLRINHDVVIIVGQKKKGFGNSVAVKRMWIIDPDEEENEDDDEQAIRES